VVKYSAYLANDSIIKNPVELTEEEEDYYVKFSLYGESQPQSITFLRPAIKISRIKNEDYDLNMNATPQSHSTRSKRSYSVQGSYEAIFYLSYEGKNAQDTAN
ncbi:hypothetical protein, partial [Vibrio sp. F13]